MDRLGHLGLADNNLNGQIPGSLNRLDLEFLTLSGNSFQGCIPVGLPQVARNDLDNDVGFQWMPSCPPALGVWDTPSKGLNCV